jgi:branched-chain amino acid transport system substrate-binding protein
MDSWSRWRIVALLAILALALAACGGDDDEADNGGNTGGGSGEASTEPIRLGFSVMVTGDGSTIGVPFLNGAETAVAEINADGGIDGRQVELVVEDNETRPQAGVEVALKLIESDNVDALICSCFSTLMFPISDAIAQLDTVVFNNGSSTPEVRTLEGNIVTPFPLDDVLGRELAQFAWDEGHTQAALVTVNDPYGVGYREEVGNAYRELGGEIVVDIVTEPGLPDYRPEMRRVVEAGAEAILLGTAQSDARLQFNQLVGLGWDGGAFKLYPTATELDQDPEAVGHYFGIESTWLEEESQDFITAYGEQTGGEEPDYWAALGYDNIQLAARAVAAAEDPSDPESVLAALTEVSGEYTGPTGAFEFDEDFVRSNPELVRYALEEDGFVVVDE